MRGKTTEETEIAVYLVGRSQPRRSGAVITLDNGQGVLLVDADQQDSAMVLFPSQTHSQQLDAINEGRHSPGAAGRADTAYDIRQAKTPVGQFAPFRPRKD